MDGTWGTRSVKRPMHLIEILLPLRDANGEAFPAAYYDDLAQHLTHPVRAHGSGLRRLQRLPALSFRLALRRASPPFGDLGEEPIDVVGRDIRHLAQPPFQLGPDQATGPAEAHEQHGLVDLHPSFLPCRRLRMHPFQLKPRNSSSLDLLEKSSSMV